MSFLFSLPLAGGDFSGFVQYNALAGSGIYTPWESFATIGMTLAVLGFMIRAIVLVKLVVMGQQVPHLVIQVLGGIGGLFLLNAFL